MANKSLKTAFKKARTIPPLYTGGPVAITSDGQRLITCVGEELLLTDTSTGTQIASFAGDTQSITSICVSPSSSHLLVFSSSLALRVFELPRSLDVVSKPVQPIRVIAKAHEAPVHVCTTDPTSTYLASGSADGVVKVWDIIRGYVTHVFKGHGGVVSAISFNYPQDPSSISQRAQMQLITASVDTRIRIFELSEASRANSKPGAVLEGHVSVPRALDVSSDGKWLISGGRDSVVLVWDLSSMNLQTGSKRKGKDREAVPRLLKTIPILERVEAAGLLEYDEDLTGSPSDPTNLRFYTGGENGVIKIWSVREGTVLFTLGTEGSQISDDQEEQRQIVDVLYNPATSGLISVHADQNILFHSLTSHALTRQLIGYNDEIVDATFLTSQSKDSHIAVATNSSLIRVYSGPQGIVLCVDHSADGRLLASGSKDRTARIWAPIESSSDWGYGCVAVCEGHAESVGAIAMSRKLEEESTSTTPRFLFTGSQDRTIKMWDVSSVATTASEGVDVERCKSMTTLKAHDKDINSLDVAPNDRYLVSGSQDRTAKIFEIEYVNGARGVSGSLKHIGTCKGHKRGVWSRVLATGSGDKTVKLWNLEDFSCVKTFEGHTNSVLRLVSAGSDGLVKVWNVKDEECMVTMDNHEDKVWALAVSADDSTIVSGAADSVITFWQDNTIEEQTEKETQRADLVSKEQDFQNYLSLRDYRRAISLALAMEQPGRLLSLFRDLHASLDPASISGNASVDEVIRTLYGPDLAKLLRYVRDWNANAKTSTVAQQVLYTVVKMRTAEDVSKAFHVQIGDDGVDTAKASTALKELIDALLPYTERHLSRMDKLVQESYMIDYVLSEMDDGMFDGGDEEMDIDGL
ncbi:WD40 repeat-like protein [Mucidula mucida]|nr:WD40 repeat-like protein [Mucidula mucida]